MAFHYVLEGRFSARIDGGTPIRVEAGDALLFARNELHVLYTSAGLGPASVGRLVSVDERGFGRVSHGGNGERSRVVCGFISVRPVEHSLLAGLPDMLKVRLAGTPAGAIAALLPHYGSGALSRDDPGGEAVLNAINLLLLSEAFRQYLDEDPSAVWWQALRDPMLRKAIALLHGDPGADWTIDALAKQVGTSRAVLAGRFKSGVGEPVLAYLTKWRMELAARRLEETKDPIAEIAFELGYGSEASFCRAFSRRFGMPPARWRRAEGPSARIGPAGAAARRSNIGVIDQAE